MQRDNAFAKFYLDSRSYSCYQWLSLTFASLQSLLEANRKKITKTSTRYSYSLELYLSNASLYVSITRFY